MNHRTLFIRPGALAFNDAMPATVRAPGGEAVGVILDAPLVHGGAPTPLPIGEALGAAAPGGFVAVWSGTLGTSLFERERANWGEPAWITLARAAADAQHALAPHGARLLIRPHARHIVSDGPRCARVARELAESGVGLLLDPVSMLEPSMVPNATDHVRRWVGELGPSSAAILIGSVAPGRATEDEAPPLRAPLGSGAIPEAAWREAMAALGDAAPPFVVEGHADAAALGLIA